MRTSYPIRTLQSLEIVGGALCLDLANTINSRRKPEYDYLTKYSDLTDWAVKVGILSVSQGNQLQKQAEQDAGESRDAFDKAILLREMFYRLFSRIAKRSEPDPGDMEAFIKFYAEATAHGVFVRKDHYFVMDWPVDETPDALLWPIIYSAGQLLLSNELVHIKECPGCGWLFLDTSKNQSRRWCSMNACGARDKMRRYHRRLRETGS